MPMCKQIPAAAPRLVQEWPQLTDHNSYQLTRALHAGMINEEPNLENEIAWDPELSSTNLPPHPSLISWDG